MYTRLVDLVERIGIAIDRRAFGDQNVHDRLTAALDALRADHAAGSPTDQREDGIPGRLAGLGDVFGLDDLDVDLLLVAAAADIDANMSLIWGVLRGLDRPAHANVGLALELCGVPTTASDGFARLGVGGSLRRHRLIEVRGTGPWLSREVALPDRVSAHLLGVDHVEPVLQSALVPALPMTFPPGAVVTRALEAGAPLVWVRALRGTAGLALAAGSFAAVGLDNLAIDIRRTSPGLDLEDLLMSAAREAALRGAGLVVAGAERLGETAHMTLLDALMRARVPVVLVGNRGWDPTWLAQHPVSVDAVVLDPAERGAAWRAAAGPDIPADRLETLRLTPEAIAQAADLARALAEARGVPLTADVIVSGARAVGGSTTAGRPATVHFGDLVLPDHAGAALHRLVGWARIRDQVLSRNALFRGDPGSRGIAALFSGSPGTGKTLAANVVAGELGLDLFQVNLSEIVDKYIGETEKNLERVFHEAESMNVVLFFDEADALFGRRSEVKDAHDRYANQEVAYLLQRIERFDGITILATNLRGNLDPAFVRRMHFIIHFPDPDVSTRRRLWELYLDQQPLDPADPIDNGYLAGTLELAGGDIRNIVLSAVYDATAAGEPIGMRHLLAASVNEYHKLGRRVPASGFRNAE